MMIPIGRKAAIVRCRSHIGLSKSISNNGKSISRKSLLSTSITSKSTNAANVAKVANASKVSKVSNAAVAYSCSFSSSSNNSSSNSFQYEYPTRTEAPTITRTVASNSNSNVHSNSNSNFDNVNNLNDVNVSFDSNVNVKLQHSNNNYIDHFDDRQTLSPIEQSTILSKQKQQLNTTLPSTFAIQLTPPSNVPPNLPQQSLTLPVTQISTLSNGIRVASQETYGQVCTFGLISNCGSRLESNVHHTTGVNHLMELLAFCGTSIDSSSTKLDSTSYQNTLDTLGGVSFASSSREQFLYCIDVLRPNVDQAFYMLQDVIFNPNINEHVVDEMKKVIEFQWMDIIPEILLSEGLQFAAYGNLQQLGQSHFCKSNTNTVSILKLLKFLSLFFFSYTFIYFYFAFFYIFIYVYYLGPLEALPHLTAQTVINFRNQYLLNPKSMVVAAAGIQHEHLVSLAETYFGHLQTPSTKTKDDNNDNGVVESKYRGGSHRQTIITPDGYTRVALAFPTGGWHSKDLVPACVLQTLLGGGNSFSAGGPGKGMYSRLYRQILNRYYWAESCEAFTSFHNECGLMGISGSTSPHKVGDMTKVLAEHFMKLALDYVEDEELDRARNMLKCNVLTQLESRLVLFEDVGRQILTYNKREESKDMCEKIDSVTKDDLRNLARASIVGIKPTLCTVGDDVTNVPELDDIERWFQNIK